MSATRPSHVAHTLSPVLARSLSLVLAALACRETPTRPAPAELAPDAAQPPWQFSSSRAPTPPRGMVWVPEGALVAGTPEGRIPRIADQEMPGQQLVLHGFFMDMFAYPNEEGAIPHTGVTQSEAEALCAEQGKRLCSELEWERACKGPENSIYEYGDRYRADVCSTGRSPRMLPNGYRQGCRSEFGVRDLHGGVWEWTASRWGRGGDPKLVALRGGNGEAGDVVGRCANAVPRAPAAGSATIGFRCCQGEVNEARVTITLDRGKALDSRPQVEASVAQRFASIVPEEVNRALDGFGSWEPAALWDWRPIANTRFLVGGGCAGNARAQRCGVLVAELVSGQPQFMAWVWSGIWPATVRTATDSRSKLWVYGGDRTSQLRQAVWFESGRLRLGEVQRRFSPNAEWKARPVRASEDAAAMPAPVR
ncbi:MAG TPA: SUMF1/EgtB/PvdO family nonheme iron enzyme [Polyangiaceae bacterium]|nr:SUMF1/EgtB/PvdO family nonheme iron enzyme [Polyangiaceae bacterium]